MMISKLDQGNGEEYIVPADRKLRNQLLIGIILFSIIMLPVLHLLSSTFQELKILARSDATLAARKARVLLLELAVMNAAATVSFGFYSIRIGLKTWQSGRFPPPGMRVIRDTRVRRGASAKAAAVMHYLLASMGILPNLAILYLYWIL